MLCGCGEGCRTRRPHGAQIPDRNGGRISAASRCSSPSQRDAGRPSRCSWMPVCAFFWEGLPVFGPSGHLVAGWVRGTETQIYSYSCGRDWGSVQPGYRLGLGSRSRFVCGQGIRLVSLGHLLSLDGLAFHLLLLLGRKMGCYRMLKWDAIECGVPPPPLTAPPPLHFHPSATTTFSHVQIQ